MADDTVLNIGVRPKCARCERLAVTFDDEDTPLCARHATIFMTADKMKGEPEPSGTD